jgi:aminopeptidase N
VERRMAVQQASVINIYSDSAPANLDQVADYFFLATPTELPESPKIGILLDTQVEKGQSLLKISQLSPHGKAAAAGLQEGDILKEVNGYPVSDMADLRIAMLGAKSGETIDIKVVRTKREKDQELVCKVELTLPPAALSPHP